MSSNSDDSQADVVAEQKKRFSNVIADRIKDGFYVYLVTSLALNNWAIIFTLFKSKKPIEETISTITSQPGFILHSFWIPLGYGVVAAILMPWIIVLYMKLAARATIQIKSAVEDHQRKREQNLELKKLAHEEMLLIKQASNDEIYTQSKLAKEGLNSLRREVALADSQREYFQNFLMRLNNVYKEIPRVETIDDFKHFFEKAMSEKIFDHYQGYLIAREASVILAANNTPPKPTDPTDPTDPT